MQAAPHRDAVRHAISRPEVRQLACYAWVTSLLLFAGGCHRAHTENVVAEWYARVSMPSRVAPATPEEATALELMLTSQPDAGVIMLAESTLRLEPTYRSATGYPCRGFYLDRVPVVTPSHRRLACLDGRSWVLVPDLLEDGTMDGPEDMP
jgi:hypothetical protein